MRYDRVAVQETSPSQDHGPLVHPRGAAEDGEHEERNRLAHRLGRTDDQVDRVQARVSGTPPRPRAQTSSARSHRVTRLSAPTATRAPAATRRHGLVPGRTGSTNLDAGRRQTRRSPTRLRRRARLRRDAPAVARTRRQSRRRHRHRTVGRARASERVTPAAGRSSPSRTPTPDAYRPACAPHLPPESFPALVCGRLDVMATVLNTFMSSGRRDDSWTPTTSPRRH